METDELATSEMLISVLSASINKHLTSDCGVLFSGGVDSSLITVLLQKHIPDTKLFTVGLEGSNDIIWALAAAKLLGLEDNLHRRIIDRNDIESMLPEVIGILRTTDPMTISLAIPVYIVCIEARTQNIGLLLTGQGADELFGGYYRYRKIAQNSTDTIDTLQIAIAADVSALPERDIERDRTIAKAAGIKLFLPYMDTGVLGVGLSIPSGLKVKEMNGSIIGKYILRRAAEKVLPEEIAWRDKKALQYGSGVWAALSKIARLYGYKKQDKGFIRKYLHSVAEDNKIKLDVTS
jgi:asparagine synthase (glutamine-hydrolysing)